MTCSLAGDTGAPPARRRTCGLSAQPASCACSSVTPVASSTAWNMSGSATSSAGSAQGLRARCMVSTTTAAVTSVGQSLIRGSGGRGGGRGGAGGAGSAG